MLQNQVILSQGKTNANSHIQRHNLTSMLPSICFTHNVPLPINSILMIGNFPSPALHPATNRPTTALSSSNLHRNLRVGTLLPNMHLFTI